MVTVVTVVVVVVVSVVLVLELVLVELLVLELVLVELLVLVVVEGAAVSATVGAVAVFFGDRAPQLSCSAASSAETVTSLASQPPSFPSPPPVEADKRASSGSSVQLHAGGVPVPDATTAMPTTKPTITRPMTPTTIFIEVDAGCADEPGGANALGTAPPALSPS